MYWCLFHTCYYNLDKECHPIPPDFIIYVHVHVYVEISCSWISLYYSMYTGIYTKIPLSCKPRLVLLLLSLSVSSSSSSSSSQLSPILSHLMGNEMSIQFISGVKKKILNLFSWWTVIILQYYSKCCFISCSFF